MSSPSDAPLPAPANDPLRELRAEIDRLDDIIIGALADRYALLKHVVAVKVEHNIPFRVNPRVAQVIERNTKHGVDKGLPADLVRHLYEEIIEAAHDYERVFLEKKAD